MSKSNKRIIGKHIKEYLWTLSFLKMAERSSRDHDKVFYLPSSEGPVLESSSICGIEPSLISRPEPSIDWLGEEIGAVTAVKVTQASRGPDIFDVWKNWINKWLATNKRLPAAADILKNVNFRRPVRAHRVDVDQFHVHCIRWVLQWMINWFTSTWYNESVLTIKRAAYNSGQSLKLSKPNKQTIKSPGTF